MRTDPRLVALIGILSAGAAGATIALTTVPGPAVPGVVTLAIIASLLLGAEVMVVRVRLGNETMALSMTEAVLGPALLLVPIAALLPLVAAAQVGAGLVHRLAPRKIAFNVASWSAAAVGGAAVFQALPRPGGLGPRLGVLAVALTAMALVNAAAFLGVARITRGDALLALLRTVGPSLLTGWTVNIAFALLLGAAWPAGALAIALTAVPLAVLHLASRAHAAASADAHRLTQIHHALRALSGPGLAEPISRFLAAVREVFDAEHAELCLVERDGPHGYLADTHGVREVTGEDQVAYALLRAGYGATATTVERGGSAIAPLLRTHGHRTCLSAPIREGDMVIGMLVVFDRSGREGSAQGQLAVLEALATEAAGALMRAALARSLVEERRTTAGLIDHASDGICSILADGTVETWNPSMESITGAAAGTVIGRSAAAAFIVRDADGVRVSLDRWADHEGTLPAELELTATDGAVRWIACSYARMDATADRAATLIIIARDVTAARELDRMKEDFVATVSHELRTPLTPILGWAETLVTAGERLSPDERAAAAASLLRQAKGLESLIIGLLEASRVQRGTLELARIPVDMRRVVERTVDACRELSPERRFVVQHDGQATMTLGDEAWLERVVSNLLSNADKYSPVGTAITITIAAADGELTVAIADEGPGIPPAEHEHIFERFRRLGDPLTRAQSGVGLGLFISQQIAHAHGGRIEVQSEPGRGSTFLLHLPGGRRLAAVG